MIFWQRLVRKPIAAVTSRVFLLQYQVENAVSDPLPSARKIMLILLNGKMSLAAEANQPLKHAITPVLVVDDF